MAGQDDEESGFLDRFDERPRESGRVVRKTFPNLDEPDETTPHGPVDADEPTERRRWVRWVVVAVIWLVALMLVGSVLLRAL